MCLGPRSRAALDACLAGRRAGTRDVEQDPPLKKISDQLEKRFAGPAMDRRRAAARDAALDAMRRGMSARDALARLRDDFQHLENQLAHRKGVRDPAGLAAKIGRKKLGKAAFQRRAAAGERRAQR